MKEIVETQPDVLAISPVIPEVTILLAVVLPESSMVSFGVGCTLDDFKFVGDKEWCVKAADVIVSINLKGTVDTLTMDQDSLDNLNNKAFGFAMMILARLPSFVGTRVSGEKIYIQEVIGIRSHSNQSYLL